MFFLRYNEYTFFLYHALLITRFLSSRSHRRNKAIFRILEFEEIMRFLNISHPHVICDDLKVILHRYSVYYYSHCMFYQFKHHKTYLCTVLMPQTKVNWKLHIIYHNIHLINKKVFSTKRNRKRTVIYFYSRKCRTNKNIN